MFKGFRTAFVAHVPDADPTKHRCTIATPLYKLTSVLVKNNEEAIEVYKELAQKEGFAHSSCAQGSRTRL